MDKNMSQLKDKMTMDSTHLTEEISTSSANIARLSGEMTALSVRVIEHQGHLENLLGLEEARQAQMDDHWREMTKLKTLINKVKSTTATQTQRLTAQLDGLCFNNKIVHSTARNDITDLHCCIIPSLCDTSTAIALELNYSTTISMP